VLQILSRICSYPELATCQFFKIRIGLIILDTDPAKKVQDMPGESLSTFSAEQGVSLYTCALFFF
jgi:hypothetical protein